jgi:hypothetical protein
MNIWSHQRRNERTMHGKLAWARADIGGDPIR